MHVHHSHATRGPQAEKEKMIEEIIDKAMNEIDVDGSETITFEVRPPRRSVPHRRRARCRPVIRMTCARPPRLGRSSRARSDTGHSSFPNTLGRTLPDVRSCTDAHASTLPQAGANFGVFWAEHRDAAGLVLAFFSNLAITRSFGLIGRASD
jgi:hypothetical protein